VSLSIIRGGWMDLLGSGDATHGAGARAGAGPMETGHWQCAEVAEGRGWDR